jgi:hypothetical protein
VIAGEECPSHRAKVTTDSPPIPRVATDHPAAARPERIISNPLPGAATT